MPSADASSDAEAKILGYDCKGLATAVLLASLMDHLGAYRGVVADEVPELVDHPDIQQMDPPQRTFTVNMS